MIKLFLGLLMFSNVAFAFDFKGIEVGERTLVETIENTLLIECRDGSSGWDVWCEGKTTIVGSDAEAFVKMDKNHIVQSIAIKFEPNNFKDIATALIKKYGKTKIKKSTLKNATGASFEQIEMIWRKKGGFMSLSKYTDKIFKGALIIVTDEELIKSSVQSEKDKSDI